MNSINDTMTAEKVKTFTVIKNTNLIASEQVLAWAKWVENQRAQGIMLTDIQESRDFNMMRHINHNISNSNAQPSHKNMQNTWKCLYIGSKHIPIQCPCYGKMCSSHGRKNHF